MNPYSPPASTGLPYRPALAHADENAVTSDGVVEVLRQTRPWATVFGVLCLLGSAVMMFVSAGVMFMTSPIAGARGGVLRNAIGLFYLPLATVYIYPGVKGHGGGRCVPAIFRGVETLSCNVARRRA
jgi:hypothetical protein